jgi:hypothetical protein
MALWIWTSIWSSEMAAQQGDAPDEALELKVHDPDPGVINVRLAGDPGC